MKRQNFTLLVSIIGFLWSTPLYGQTGKNFYEGKVITYLVGSTAGGGSDLTARLVARHLERHIPGKPRIDVVNKPGAGGMIAMNELYNLRKPDGLSLVPANVSALFATAAGNDAIKFDLRKFIWIGQAFDDVQTLYVRSDTPTAASKRSEKQTKKVNCRKWGLNPWTTRATWW
jgi:tripartite-type tricarboxylate transporter receptor subunit TctC